MTRWLVGALAACAAFSTTAVAQTAPTADQLAQATLWDPPTWTQRASARDFERAHAWAPGAQQVRVTLDCLVQTEGALACARSDDPPASEAALNAAMQLAPRFRVATADAAGASTVGRRVKLRLTFSPLH